MVQFSFKLFSNVCSNFFHISFLLLFSILLFFFLNFFFPAENSQADLLFVKIFHIFTCMFHSSYTWRNQVLLTVEHSSWNRVYPRPYYPKISWKNWEQPQYSDSPSFCCSNFFPISFFSTFFSFFVQIFPPFFVCQRKFFVEFSRIVCRPLNFCSIFFIQIIYKTYKTYTTLKLVNIMIFFNLWQFYTVFNRPGSKICSYSILETDLNQSCLFLVPAWFIAIINTWLLFTFCNDVIACFNTSSKPSSNFVFIY